MQVAHWRACTSKPLTPAPPSHERVADAHTWQRTLYVGRI
jgi:hypothetical protein